MRIRTRFAPSPTGALHVGGIRTALFAWLVARQASGQFILRLEDTDKKREQPGAEKQIEDSLKSLGLNYDEGPDVGGPFGPYKQSDRLKSYKDWGQKLIEKGRAYADITPEDELDKLRQQAKDTKKPFLYRNFRPANTPKWDGSQSLRFKSEPKSYNWHDEVMGDLSAGSEAIDDFILIKSDGYPTYNFSHVIDDIEMEISHVIRGQEFIASTPNYLNLYEALDISPPALATMPHVLGPDGKKKLSKRDGAKDVLEYIRGGYLPEALVSFIASLGWNDGTEQEVYSVHELIEKFSLDRVHRSGAKFDEQRLEWTNGYFIRETDLDSLYKLTTDYWPETARDAEAAYKKRVLGLVQERLKYLAELPKLTEFFFSEPSNDNIQDLFNHPVDKQLSKLDRQELVDLLKSSKVELEKSSFEETDIAERLNGLLDKLGTKPGILFAAIRIAVTGSRSSPQLFGTLSTLGRTKSLSRLDSCIKLLEKT